MIRRRKSKTLGQSISTLVFFVMSLWLFYQANNLLSKGEFFRAMLVFIGATLSFVATFRFRLQDLFTRENKK